MVYKLNRAEGIIVILKPCFYHKSYLFNVLYPLKQHASIEVLDRSLRFELGRGLSEDGIRKLCPGCGCSVITLARMKDNKRSAFSERDSQYEMNGRSARSDLAET